MITSLYSRLKQSTTRRDDGNRDWGEQRRNRNHGRQAALQGRRSEVPADGLLGAGLRSQGYGHHLPVPHHAAGGGRPGRGRRGGRGGVGPKSEGRRVGEKG